jgi:hypothetical protein
MKLRIVCMMVASLSLFFALTPFAVAQTSAQASAQSASALPRMVRFGGTVKDLNGNPLTGVVGVTFAFYSEQTGGAALWLETQNLTADTHGRYTALLGSTVPEGLPADLFTSEQAHWVGVQVSGQAEQPRVLLVSAPYALKAGDAETIGGLPPSAFVLTNGSQGAAGGAKQAGAQASSGIQKNTATPANPAVTGKGVVDFIPMWDSTSDIVDSVIFQKAAAIGIGTITPAATLDVNGKTAVRDTLLLFPKGTDSTLAISGTPFKIDQTGKMTFIATQTFPGTGTITGITTAAGSGLTGGGAKGTLTLKVPAAGITNAMLADSKIALNSNSAGGLTVPGAMSLGGVYTIGLKPCATSQILQYTGTAWVCVAPTGTGTITGVIAGTDLTGGGTGGKVTLNLDTTKVPQLSAANVFAANQTVNGSLIVGTGTPAPLSILEALASAPEALGPSLTLTNNLANGNFGGSSIDFNTYAPGTSGTYNPSSRIEAFGDGGGGDSLWFESNNDKLFGGPNQGLALNMNIGSNGRVNIGTQDTDPNDFFEQLVVTSAPLSGSGETAAIGAFGGTPTGVTDANGSAGIYAVGGDAVGNAQADFAGDGGEFYGGFTPESSSGAAGYGIYSSGGVGGVGVAAFAGYFDGDIEVTGTVFGSVKDFKIDHPLDPANKYLVHTSVESSEMMNIYTGNVVTDELGMATVKLPDWFEAENADFRYQLTVIGRRAQAWIAEEVEQGQFKIGSDATQTKISWQITAVRQDAFAKAHPLVVEQQKPARERGFYQNPELFGQPAERQTEWGRRPLQMERMKETRERQKLAARQRFTHSRDQPVSAVSKNRSSLGVASH